MDILKNSQEGADMIKEIANKIKTIIEQSDDSSGDSEKKIVILDPSSLTGEELEPDTALNTIGLFCDVTEEKVAEIIHGLLYLDNANKHTEKEENKRPIEFYVSTYGGSADDMFGLYDVMRNVRKNSEIHTIGVGKVMSAGVLILAGGTKGKRQIGRNCRVMIHAVMGGNHGSLHNMVNEMEAIEQLQDMYCDALINETNLTKKQLKKMLERKVNVYLTAEEAVELGIADIII
jgi:ATP-dependent Clp protease protease subunit